MSCDTSGVGGKEPPTLGWASMKLHRDDLFPSTKVPVQMQSITGYLSY